MSLGGGFESMPVFDVELRLRSPDDSEPESIPWRLEPAPGDAGGFRSLSCSGSGVGSIASTRIDGERMSTVEI
ncbi:MAG: hypothetical protein R2697_14000 [Ilumatobacteraceae bacterium]